MSRFLDANLISYEPSRWLTYDDVVLLPQYNEFPSRNDPRISLQTKLCNDIILNTPLVSANMDTITEAEMAVKMSQYGGLGILHRFYQEHSQFEADLDLLYENVKYPAFSIGLDESHLSFVDKILKKRGNAIVCVDTAHGDSQMCFKQVRQLRLAFDRQVRIIAGNICTVPGAKLLIEAGADCLKVGVGGGSLCSTRMVTGHGLPNLSSIMMVRKAINGMGVNVGLIADGGIRNSGDAIKALAAGANAVMIGRLLAGSDKTPGKLYHQDGTEATGNEDLYKRYRGQASQHFMDDIGKTDVAPEGEHTYVPATGLTDDIIKNMSAGIRSGLTYSGVKNINELSDRAVFCEVSTASYIEGTPHGK